MGATLFKPFHAGAVIALGAAAMAVLPEAGAMTSQLQPESLAQAHVIRDDVTGRHWLEPGRKLVVTEATTTAVVESLTLVTDWLEPSVVPADNGIYFALCSARATCPYPRRPASWPAIAFTPRLLALELAVAIFSQTPVRLVVVSLPTASPVWVVFDRDDFTRELHAAGVLDRGLRGSVDRLTLSRLYVPLEIASAGPGADTLVAVRYSTP